MSTDTELRRAFQDVSVPTSFTESLAIQKRVVSALFFRESVTRFGKNNLGFLWLFVEPSLFTLGVTAIWVATKAVHGSTIPIIVFGITGYSTIQLWRMMPSRCIDALEPNLALLYHRNIKIIDIYFARVLLELVGVTISFFILSLLVVIFGWVAPPEDIFKIIWGWFLLAWFAVALAITVGSLSELSELVHKLWPPFSYLLFPASGAAFLVSSLPEAAQAYVLYVPMVNCTELIRDGFFGSQFDAKYDVGYVLMWNLALSVIGLTFTRVVSRKVIPQ